MTAVEIKDVKGFMGKLLASDTFDDFLILEAVITKANTFTIDGRLNEEYLSDLENEDQSDGGDKTLVGKLQTWGNVRSFCFELIKGKTLPVYMKVVLQKSGEEADHYLNIVYDRKELKVVTGTSLRTFTLDKSLEQEWDQSAEDLLKEYI